MMHSTNYFLSITVYLFIHSDLNNASAVEHVFGPHNYISALSLSSSLKAKPFNFNFLKYFLSIIVYLFIHSDLNNASAVEHLFGPHNYLSALSLSSSSKAKFLNFKF